MLIIFNYAILNRLTNITIFEIATDPILIDYGSKSGSNFRAWVVQVPLFDLSDSNTFFFTLNVKSDAHAWPLLSVYFNITDQSDSGSSSAMPTLTLGSSHSTAISASVPTVTSLTQSTVGSVLWGTETVSTVRTATSSSSPSSAPLNGISRETLGIALGIGIPVLMALLGTLFVLLKNIKLLKRKTLPDENLSQCTSKHVRSCQQIFEVAGDFTYRDEPSGDRNPSHFAELPA